MTNVRVLLLPGRGNSGERHWQSHWEKRQPQFRRVLQQEWSNPNREDWVAALQTVIEEDERPVVLVAHSLSVSLVLHWAQRHRGPIKGALLVAPSDVEAADYPAGTQGFTPIPLQPLPFPSVVVTSTNDPKVTLERARQFADAWGARLEVAGAHGHLGADADLGDWPFGRALLDELLGNTTPGSTA